MADDIKTTYDSGAVRSGKCFRFRDIPHALKRRIARAFSEGAEKYERAEDGWEPFEKNWKTGDLVFALDVLDHAHEHLDFYTETILARLNNELVSSEFKPDEDHLGHCGANLAMLAWFEAQGMFEPEPEVETDVQPPSWPSTLTPGKEETAVATLDNIAKAIRKVFGGSDIS